jgi:hypothetical protein
MAGPAWCPGTVPAGLVRRGAGFPAASVRPRQPGPVLAGDGPPGRRRAAGACDRDRRPRHGHRPPGAGVLAGHVPAARHRPGHARPAGPAGARRADERPRPAADQGDARCPRPVRSRRPDGGPVQSHAGRGGADLHARGRDGHGQAPRGRPGRRDRRCGIGIGRRHPAGAAGSRRAGRDAGHRRRRAAPRRGPRAPQRRRRVRRRRRAGQGRDPGGARDTEPPPGGRLPRPHRRFGGHNAGDQR